MRARRLVRGGAVGEAAAAVERLVRPAPAHGVAARLGLDLLPELERRLGAIQERVFAVDDPEAEFDYLERRLQVREALTPGVLQAALNEAEDCARRAHRLYVVAQADLDRFGRESDAVLDAMRDAAAAELEQERRGKQRTKNITDADVRGRVATLFPDEWRRVNDRQVRGRLMVEHLEQLAKLWRNRCYSIGTMLAAGKRS